MSLPTSLTRFLLDFHRLTAESTPQAVTTAVAGVLFRSLSPARVTVQLQTQPAGIPFAHSSSGQLLQGEARLVFSRPLVLRGQQLGEMRIELLAPDVSLASVVPALETLSKLLSLYSERIHLEQTNANLRRRLEQAKDDLRSDKLIARVGGQIAWRRRISQSAGEQWIRAEAARQGRSAISFAEELIEGRHRARPGLPVALRTSRKREVAA